MTQSVFSRFRLDGRCALVTGASSGLGLHFARVLAMAGARVILTARTSEKLAGHISRLRSEGFDADATILDVTCAHSVKRCFDCAVEVAVPDIVINNAGVTLTQPALDHSEQDWDHVMNTNLKGCWLVATEAARRLREVGRAGSIVNVASILGERVAGGVAPYAISKAGMVQATKALALELARYRIQVNALLPGYVHTDLNRDFMRSEAGQRLLSRIPSRRFCVPEDLDGPLLLLASDAGSAMTGSCLVVDGGHLVSSL